LYGSDDFFLLLSFFALLDPFEYVAGRYCKVFHDITSLSDFLKQGFLVRYYIVFPKLLKDSAQRMNDKWYLARLKACKAA
jgi:hypothetical protein